MAKYRIHFTDDYGQGTLECETREEFDEIIKNLYNDPACEDIWTETYYEDEGWQA